MSLRAFLWALDEAPVTNPISKLILIALADEANDEGGDCFPSMDRIGHRAGVTRNTVRDHLRRLETEYDVIEVERPTVRGRGHYNRYRLKLEKGEHLTPSEPERGEPPSGKGGERGEPDSPIPVDPSLLDPEKKTNGQVIDDEFAEWWAQSVWWKTSKGQALKAFRGARKKVGLDVLHVEAVAYGKRVTEYQKHPSTWLNGECWLDEPAPKPETAAQRAAAKLIAQGIR